MPVNRRTRGDDGAVSVLFGILVVSLLAIGTLMIDVGAVYVEGRGVQGGAETAAFAVAKSCITAPPCNADAGAVVADANGAGARQVDVDLVCGTAPGLKECLTEATRARFGCRPLSASTAPYVQVQTRSASPLPGLLSKLADEDEDGTSVRACARTNYGSPTALTGELPLAISRCEHDYWQKLFGYAMPDAAGDFPAASEAVLYFLNTGDLGPSDCPKRNSNSNQDSPGGFGWLTTTTSCSVATDVMGDAVEKPGNSVPKACDEADFSGLLGTVVHIPAFSSISKAGTYDIVGYAAFHLSGYNLSGNKAFQRPSPNLGVPCAKAKNAVCISGWFTSAPAPSNGPLGPGPGFGSKTIKLAG